MASGPGPSEGASPTGDPLSPSSSDLASIAELLSDAIVTVDADQRLLGGDPRVTRLLGFSPSEIMGQDLSVLVVPRWRGVIEDLVLAAAAGAPLGPKHLQLHHRGGRSVDVEAMVVPLNRIGGQDVPGFALAIRDISERKQFEAELQHLLALERHTIERQSATTNLRSSIMDGLSMDAVMARVAHYACTLLDATTAVVSQLRPDARALVHAVSTTATDPPDGIERGRDIDVQGDFVEQVVERGTVVVVDHLGGDDRPDVQNLSTAPSGPAAGVAIVHENRVWGALTLVRGPESWPFTSGEIDTLSELAAQAGLALDVERARSEHDRLVLLEEQERLAADLHDRIIQDLFAIGLSVAAIRSRLMAGHPNKNVVEGAVTGLGSITNQIDTAIRGLRRTIFALNHGLAGAAIGLHLRLLRLVDESTAGWDIQVTSDIDPVPESAVPPVVGEDLLAVAREALSNIARHAKAQHVTVTAGYADGAVRLVVVDDGVGIGETRRRSGLANMRRRAERHGGTFELVTPPEGGTRLVWTAPGTGSTRKGGSS